MAKYNSSNNGSTAEDRALERFAEMLGEKIKTIQSDWQKPWFTEGAMLWPRNLSGREYNGGNALMLMLHCEQNGYKLPVFCTFNRVSGLNFTVDKDGNHRPAVDKDGQPLPQVSVNKGEKSFPIFLTTYTVVNKETKEKIKYEDYRRLTNEEKKAYNVYPKNQVFNVFNVAQTNLEQARPQLFAKLQADCQQSRPEEIQGEKYVFHPLDAMINQGLWICPIKPTYGDKAFYSISRNEIVVPEYEQFKDGESFATNCMHEMAHSTGADNVLGRLKGGAAFGSPEYSREELVAELTAALVASRYGFSKHVKEDSCAYLKSWLDHINEDPQYLKTVLCDVKKASTMISQRIDLIQQQIDDYQQSTGRTDYPDVIDIDMDGNTQEAAYSENLPFNQVEEEYVPFRRSR